MSSRASFSRVWWFGDLIHNNKVTIDCLPLISQSRAICAFWIVPKSLSVSLTLWLYPREGTWMITLRLLFILCQDTAMSYQTTATLMWEHVWGHRLRSTAMCMVNVLSQTSFKSGKTQFLSWMIFIHCKQHTHNYMQSLNIKTCLLEN